MNLKPSKFGKLMMPMFAFFNIINLIFLIRGSWWDNLKVDHIVVIFGNALLFLISLITLWFHLKASKSDNPNVLVRSVMGSSFLKIIVVGASVFVYVKYSGENRSNMAIIVSMVLYLVYTFLEIKAATSLQRKK